MNKSFLFAVKRFYEAAKEEYGDHVGGEQALAMFDALDPEIRGALLFDAFTGSNRLCIIRDPRVADEDVRTIHAIKTIRAVFGYGLKEAKDITDQAKMGGEGIINDSSTEQREELYRGLLKSGFLIG